MKTETIEVRLEQVVRLMSEVLAATVLGRLAGDCRGLIGSGKLLRARLLLRLAPARRIPKPTWLAAAAAVEMIHAASLLHDDVIDGGILRRHLPSFWKKRGVPGAILAGDLMLVQALELLIRAEDPRLLGELVRHTSVLCDAEAEQELMSRGARLDWRQCLDINRRKTGSLFAFAAGAAAGADERLQDALQEAGFTLGTAYQLADDILDSSGDESVAGKTLGRDRARHKHTAATVLGHAPNELMQSFQALRASALEQTRPWPEIHAALQDYCTEDFDPAVAPMLARLAPVP